MLFRNKCCHAIALVFVLSHFILNFVQNFSQQRAGYHLVEIDLSFLNFKTKPIETLT
jgi:hypothetical protein